MPTKSRSSTTTDRRPRGRREIPATHPGEILNLEFLAPMGLSQYALARAICVPPRRINEIVKGLRGISADTALRLGRYFGMDPRFWMNLQAHYDMEQARDALGPRLEREVAVRA